MSNSELPATGTTTTGTTAVEATGEKINKLAADLRMFATGSYLQPEEREFWEPLFDESVADDVASALREAVDGIDKAAQLPVGNRGQLAEEVAAECLRRIAEIERAQGGSIFDEELDEILGILNLAVSAVGLDVAEVSAETYAELA